MSKATDTEKPVETLFQDDEDGNLYRVVAPDPAAEPDTPEDKQKRKERLAQREAERRTRSEEIFYRKRWTREEAIHWVAFRDKHSFEKSIRAAALYDQDSFVDREPRRSLVEAKSKDWVLEFTDDRGEVWYESERVRAVFRDSGGSSPPPRTGKPNLPQTIADFLLARFGNRRPSMTIPQISEFLMTNAIAEDGIQRPSESSVKRAVAKAWPEKRKAGRPRAK